MSETEILMEVLNEIKLLREEIAGNNRPTISTIEACRLLQIKDQRILTYFHRQGILPSRYGAQRSGYKYLRSEVQVLQSKLLSGEIQLPKK